MCVGVEDLGSFHVLWSTWKLVSSCFVFLMIEGVQMVFPWQLFILDGVGVLCLGQSCIMGNCPVPWTIYQSLKFNSVPRANITYFKQFSLTFTNIATYHLMCKLFKKSFTKNCSLFWKNHMVKSNATSSLLDLQIQ